MEYAHTFNTLGKNQLLSIIHPGRVCSKQEPNKIGVVIVVGGPQYRVGSHRQFVQLARHLANDGFTCMRFDYTGMGDSQGQKAAFDNIDGDIKSAIDALLNEQPQLEQVVLWGLCDAASAALIYGHQDKRIAGMVILNPWLRSDQAMGKTMFKHYYLQRLLSKDFWRKLVTGKVNVKASVKDVKGFATDTLGANELTGQSSYQLRMQHGLNQFKGRLLLILSGNDLTAKEFEQQAFGDKAWRQIQSTQCLTERLPESDHTFSTKAWKQEVEVLTLNFLNKIKR